MAGPARTSWPRECRSTSPLPMSTTSCPGSFLPWFIYPDLYRPSQTTEHLVCKQTHPQGGEDGAPGDWGGRPGGQPGHHCHRLWPGLQQWSQVSILFICSTVLIKKLRPVTWLHSKCDSCYVISVCHASCRPDYCAVGISGDCWTDWYLKYPMLYTCNGCKQLKSWRRKKFPQVSDWLWSLRSCDRGGQSGDSQLDLE